MDRYRRIDSDRESEFIVDDVYDITCRTYDMVAILLDSCIHNNGD